MFLKGAAIFCAIFIQSLGQTKLDVLDDNNVSESKCEALCALSGVKSEFNSETKICKCHLSKDTDDTDDGPDQKLDADKEVVIDNSEFGSTTTATTESIAANQDEFEADINPEGIVGQALHTRNYQRLVTPRRRQEPRPISHEQQRIILQQIRDHLNRLAQLSNHRLREIEMEMIRTNLRQLSQTSVIQPPQQRSRIRSGIEESRRRQHQLRPRLPHSRLIGAAAPHLTGNSSVQQETEEETTIYHGKKQRKFEIITQDPLLIDE